MFNEADSHTLMDHFPVFWKVLSTLAPNSYELKIWGNSCLRLRFEFREKQDSLSSLELTKQNAILIAENINRESEQNKISFEKVFSKLNADIKQIEDIPAQRMPRYPIPCEILHRLSPSAIQNMQLERMAMERDMSLTHAKIEATKIALSEIENEISLHASKNGGTGRLESIYPQD